MTAVGGGSSTPGDVAPYSERNIISSFALQKTSPRCVPSSAPSTPPEKAVADDAADSFSTSRTGQVVHRSGAQLFLPAGETSGGALRSFAPSFKQVAGVAVLLG